MDKYQQIKRIENLKKWINTQILWLSSHKRKLEKIEELKINSKPYKQSFITVFKALYIYICMYSLKFLVFIINIFHKISKNENSGYINKLNQKISSNNNKLQTLKLNTPKAFLYLPKMLYINLLKGYELLSYNYYYHYNIKGIFKSKNYKYYIYLTKYILQIFDDFQNTTSKSDKHLNSVDFNSRKKLLYEGLKPQIHKYSRSAYSVGTIQAGIESIEDIINQNLETNKKYEIDKNSILVSGIIKKYSNALIEKLSLLFYILLVGWGATSIWSLITLMYFYLIITSVSSITNIYIDEAFNTLMSIENFNITIFLIFILCIVLGYKTLILFFKFLIFLRDKLLSNILHYYYLKKVFYEYEKYGFVDKNIAPMVPKIKKILQISKRKGFTKYTHNEQMLVEKWIQARKLELIKVINDKITFFKGQLAESRNNIWALEKKNLNHPVLTLQRIRLEKKLSDFIALEKELSLYK